MKLPKGIVSIDNVCEAEIIAAPGADTSTPDLFFEIPHGATREAHYSAIRTMLSPDLPEDLRDYFFVNTDVGSTEYARKVAELIVRPLENAGLSDFLEPGLSERLAKTRPRSVLILRCLIPRTFIDANRVIETDATEAREAKLTTAMADYIRSEADATTLLGLHRSYHDVAERAYERVCGSGGLGLMPHTYAPKSIEIESFDEGIGKALRQAYEPELYATWEKRPSVDIISEDPDGSMLAPPRVVESIRENFAKIDIEAVENASYRLHPASMAHRYSARYPGQVLCMEIARDLLADPFSPFEEMRIGEEKVARMSAPIAAALLTELCREE